MKLCKDCKWCKIYDIGSEFARCKRIIGKKLNPVNGNEEIIYPKFNYCKIERGSSGLYIYLAKQCGKKGRFFEPKEIKLGE